MGSGYVLIISDRTDSEFLIDSCIDINAVQYRAGGNSKAKRMRSLWIVAPNPTAGRVLEGPAMAADAPAKPPMVGPGFWKVS